MSRRGTTTPTGTSDRTRGTSDQQRDQQRTGEVPQQRTGSTAVRPRRSAQEGRAAGPDPTTTKRFLRRQRARRWLVWRRVLAVAVVLAVAAGGVWLLLFSSALSVRSAVVTGTDIVSAAEVEEIAQLPVGTPLATADLDAVRARVEGLLEVRAAEVTRAWPDRIRIAVTERTAVAAVGFEGAWRGLDRDGVLFVGYDTPPAGLVKVQRKASTDAEALAEAATVIDSLPASIGNRVVSARVESVDAISLVLKGGAVVRWGSADESEKKLEVLQLLLRQEASVYDVTAPGRPTIRR